MHTPPRLALRKRSSLSAPLNLAATARAALTLRQPHQPIVIVAPKSNTDETAALKQRIADLEAQMAAVVCAGIERAQREARTAAITFAEVDNRAAYAAKTTLRAAPAKVVITTAHVDVP